MRQNFILMGVVFASVLLFHATFTNSDCVGQEATQSNTNPSTFRLSDENFASPSDQIIELPSTPKSNLNLSGIQQTPTLSDESTIQFESEGSIETIESSDSIADAEFEPSFDYFSTDAFVAPIYNSITNSTTYLAGDGDAFGWLSFEWGDGYEFEDGLTLEEGVEFDSRFNFHLLSGPTRTDLPPRLYDFIWGIRARKDFGIFGYDLRANIGVFSDFEDSARDGVRFPGSATAFFKTGLNSVFVLGVEYLDRDDIKLLPVAGIRFRGGILEADLVFPRPRLGFLLNEESKLDFRAELGGGSWDIERPDESNDVMTYSDYRVSIGIESIDSDHSLSAFEIGWAFSRELSFRESPLFMELDDSFFIRIVERY